MRGIRPAREPSHGGSPGHGVLNPGINQDRGMSHQHIMQEVGFTDNESILLIYTHNPYMYFKTRYDAIVYNYAM